MNLCQNKILMAQENRILVDDEIKRWGPSWESKGGIFIHFDKSGPDRKSWEEIPQRVKAFM